MQFRSTLPPSRLPTPTSPRADATPDAAADAAVTQAAQAVAQHIPVQAPVGFLLDALDFAWGAVYRPEPASPWSEGPATRPMPSAALMAFIRAFNPLKRDLCAAHPSTATTIAFNNAVRAALVARLPPPLRDTCPVHAPTLDYGLQRQYTQQWIATEKAHLSTNLALRVDRIARTAVSAHDALGLLALTWGAAIDGLPAPPDAVDTWRAEQAALEAQWGERIAFDLTDALRARLMASLPPPMQNAHAQLAAMDPPPASTAQDPWELHWIRACAKVMPDQ